MGTQRSGSTGFGPREACLYLSSQLATPLNKKPAAGCPGRVSFRRDSDQLPDSVFSPAFFQPAMPLE